MIDMIRDYVDIAAGLSEATASRMAGVAKQVAIESAELSVKAPGLMVTSAVGMTVGVVDLTGRSAEVANEVVRTEVQRVLARLGYVREEELAAVRTHVQRLERTLHRHHRSSRDAAEGATAQAEA